jgi:osmotically-inducible protein OsmY
VRLAGVVECNELHEDIIHIAQTVPGVHEVIADLEVRPIFPSVEL